ncbi:MAG: hypothetical protein COA78_21495 [Blastopirellula sp.]|nr:MAG: hypothetical protein COA78_21495 [Blastopirellula sp.]
MTDQPENPFASPAAESEDEYQSELSGGVSLGRWVMLSTISGALLFGTYSFLSTAIILAVLYAIGIFMGQANVADLSSMIPILAGYLLAATLYAMVGGLVTGFVHGLIWYWQRDRMKHIGPMVIAGSLFAIALLCGPLIIAAMLGWVFMGFASLITMLVWSIGICIAVWRLNLNIRKYLLSKVAVEESHVDVSN